MNIFTLPKRLKIYDGSPQDSSRASVILRIENEDIEILMRELVPIEKIVTHEPCVSPDYVSDALGLKVTKFDGINIYNGSKKGLELFYTHIETLERYLFFSFGELQPGRCVCYEEGYSEAIKENISNKKSLPEQEGLKAISISKIGIKRAAIDLEQAFLDITNPSGELQSVHDSLADLIHQAKNNLITTPLENTNIAGNRQQIEGVLNNHPEYENQLVKFKVELRGGYTKEELDILQMMKSL